MFDVSILASILKVFKQALLLFKKLKMQKLFFLYPCEVN